MKHFITIITCCATVGAMAQATLKIGSGTTLGLGSANLVLENTDLENDGTLTANTSTLKLSGSGDSNLDLGGMVLNNLIIAKTPGSTVTLLAPTGVNNQAAFTSDNTKLALGNFDFTFGPSASMASADDNEYFITNGTGMLIKQGLGTAGFTFHIGNDAATYNPLTLNENGPSDTYGVRCLANVLSNGNSGSAATSQVADAAWEVVEGAAGDANLSLTVQWNLSDELPGFDRSNCAIGRYSGGGWDFATAPLGAAGGVGPFTLSRSSLNGAGVFGAGMATALPVELIDFQAFATTKIDAMLTWQTASERQVSHFEVERLAEGAPMQSWQRVGSVEALGESQTLQTYALPDPGVGKFGGRFYYRLKVVDLDGRFEHSHVEEVSFEGSSVPASVFPNPATWGVFVQTTGGTAGRAALYAVDGRLALEAPLQGGLERIAFPASLVPGIYLMVLETENGRRTVERLVVERVR